MQNHPYKILDDLPVANKEVRPKKLIDKLLIAVFYIFIGLSISARIVAFYGLYSTLDSPFVPEYYIFQFLIKEAVHFFIIVLFIIFSFVIIKKAYRRITVVFLIAAIIALDYIVALTKQIIIQYFILPG
ncbi:MAG: hypothetical protein ACK40G_14460 [Cytophagaceae bacterium]